MFLRNIAAKITRVMLDDHFVERQTSCVQKFQIVPSHTKWVLLLPDITTIVMKDLRGVIALILQKEHRRPTGCIMSARERGRGIAGTNTAVICIFRLQEWVRRR